MANNISNLNKNISENLLPRFYRSDANKKFLQSTIDQLIQPGTVEKINGFIGRQNSKATKASDIFINSKSSTRQNYQLEPGIVIKDNLNYVNFFKDYQDYINQIEIFGGNTKRHDRLNQQEFYSWDPHIDWDKFVNFQNYYWSPTGPFTIGITGQIDILISTFDLIIKNQDGKNVYVFSSDENTYLGTTANPQISLYKGQTYYFEVNSPGNPISIKTSNQIGPNDRYTNGVEGHSIENGIIKFVVPEDAPNILYYQSEIDSELGGIFEIKSRATTTTLLDIEKEFLGKKSLVIRDRNGDEFKIDSGMKLTFSNVYPQSYLDKTYYVEGVGDSLKLVDEKKLEVFGVDFITEANENNLTYITYVVINRSSSIHSLWSRFNKWIHKDVLIKSANFNQELVNLSNKAARPIIEFEGDLCLFNYGTKFVNDIDLLDKYTDKIKYVDKKIDYYIDNCSLKELINNKLDDEKYINVLFTGCISSTENNRVYKISIVNDLLNVEESLEYSAVPSIDQVILVQQGKEYSNTVFWYTQEPTTNVGYWKPAQKKPVISDETLEYKNQAPLFDVVEIIDDEIISYSNSADNYFSGSNFSGTKIFSYKINENGISDSILNLKLSYKNIENSGDIVFNFDFEKDSFSYKKSGDLVNKNINTGFLKKISSNNLTLVNGWVKSNVYNTQPAIRIYKNTNIITTEEDKNALDYVEGKVYYPGDIIRFSDNNLYQVKTDGSVLTSGITGSPTENTDVWDFYSKSLLKVNNFDLDIFNNKNELTDLILKVYVNDVITNDWSIRDGIRYKEIILDKSVGYDDVLTIKAFTSQPINKNGFYQIPINLQYNPLNASITDFTFGEIVDHTKSIIDNLTDITPVIDLRDLKNISSYGTRFVQHTGPISLSLYHITSETNNIIKAVEYAREEYNKFKRNFITVAENLGVDTDPITHVNLILQEINQNKSSNFPYYFSDMVPYGAHKKTDFTVVNYRIKRYPLTYNSSVPNFNLDNLSNRAIYVYHNNTQLIYEKEYTFDSQQGFVVINIDLIENDIISIYEYDTTDGCFIPETPSKLGLWPKYEPKKYTDTTLVTPREMIQGHDGSLIMAYGDYRDELILELERRIFNNIKVSYNPEIFDINDIIPNYNIVNSYSLEEFNEILAPSFYQWVNLVNKDFTKPLNFDYANQMTFNYADYSALDGRSVPGYWRGIYQWMFGTDRPHLCPWEMLGFSQEPLWWMSVYGNAPYTNANLKMWKDISLGIIREPNKSVIQISKYIRSFLLDHIPVDSFGNLLGPLSSGVVNGAGMLTEDQKFTFGDVSPVEAAWRRSSYYPFSVISAALLMFPAKTFGILLDRSRIVKNSINQLVYKDTGLRIKPSSIKLPNTSTNSERIQTAGIINYLVNYIVSDKLKSLDVYETDLQTMNCQLSYRIGGFTSKDKFNLLLDSKSPLATGNIFVPKEDYDLFLNTSTPIKRVSYSGVIISKLYDGFEVKGYIRSQQYFKLYPKIGSGIAVTVGGISESYTSWSTNQFYTASKIVEYNNKFYRVKLDHDSGTTFNPQYYQLLNSLPIVGGRTATFSQAWDKSQVITIPYGTKFVTIQEVVDFLLGYGEWLKDQGFIFEDFNTNINQVLNWETSAKEFLFWTLQNWSTGEDKWDEWSADTAVSYNSIVRYNGDYYRAIRNVPIVDDNQPTSEKYYEKLDGLSTVGSSVISLSPAAFKIVLDTPLSVVNDVQNQFYGYEIFSVNGNPIFPNYLKFYREHNTFMCSAINDIGIYAATFYLVQKEQVVILNNTTIFNDLIYSPSTGYKQNRIKVSGYVSTDWNGGFNIPGFIFDQAKIQEWLPWSDYALGDMIKYKEFYYSANSFIPGSETFDVTKWLRLDEVPTSKLIPNWSYKALQFTDFHSLDSDNFDASQQKMAQHLIGYQKRQYLDNIIKDDVSEFKFYQGMIPEKGTQNVFNKLFDVLNRSEKESLEFYEEWALRLGRYGATSAYDTIEITLDESQFKNNPQGFELVKNVDSSLIDFIIRQSKLDVYVTPTNIDNWPNIFPEAKSYRPFLRSAGSVDDADIYKSLKVIDDIVNEDINLFNNNDYIWCTFDDIEWNVYKFVLSNNSIQNIEYIAADNNWKISLQSPPQVDIGSYIGINHLTNKGNGFYKVVGKDKYSLRISAEGSIFNFTDNDRLTVKYIELAGQHVRYFDDLADNRFGYKVFTKRLVSGNLLWEGGVSDVAYAAWVYNPVFSSNSLIASASNSNLQYGRTIAIDAKTGTKLITSTSLGKIFPHSRTSVDKYWVPTDVIEPPTLWFGNEVVLNESEYAKVIAISNDGEWIASAAPLAESVIFNQEDGLNVAGDTGLISNSQGVVSLYKKNGNTYDLQYTVLSPLANNSNYTENYEEFGSSLVFVGNTLLIGAIKFKNKLAGSRNTGRVYKLNYIARRYGSWIDGDSQWYDSNYSFGNFIATNADNSIVAISSQSINKGQVTLYNSADYSVITNIQSSDTERLFGRAISFSLTDNYIAISAIDNNEGVVNIYSLINTSSNATVSDYDTTLYDFVSYNYVATKIQSITNVFAGNNQNFGSKIAFIKNDNPNEIHKNRNSLAIFTNPEYLGYDVFNYDTFLYDNEINYYSYMGQRLVNIYDNYFNKWVLSESVLDIDNDVYNEDFDNGFAASQDSIFIGCPKAMVSNIDIGTIYEYRNRTSRKNFSWTIRNIESKRVDSFKIKRAYLYNKQTNNLITYLDNVDCILGKIPGIADQEIRYKTYYDPATYNDISDLSNRSDLSDVTYSKVINNTVVNVDNGLAWAKSHVGLLWWDLRTAKFVDIYGKTNNKERDITYRNSMQNSLATGASIDIYEWVETKYKPSDWDRLANTEEGLSQGISGLSLYGDSAYCISRRYDNVSSSYKNVYYYWVKNKSTVPNISNRKLSANAVSNLISNPRGQGYQYLAITGTNSFSLVNVENSLLSNNVILGIEYWIIDQTNQNIHSQWQLISNEANSQIPKNIEQKWFDSLCGKDLAGLNIPDQTLPRKLMYGIENRPRQSMFINRIEALKQLIEQANVVLKQYQIAEQRNLSKLEMFDSAPTIYTMLYDLSVDTYNELLDLDIFNVKTAKIRPIITNGRIVKVIVDEPGFGYIGNNPFKDEFNVVIGWYGPSISVSGSGQGASIISVIDNNGSLITKDSQGNDLNLVIDSGEGYLTSNTSIVVRSFSVLVNQDTLGEWSIYSYEFINNVVTWSKVKSQIYNTKNYWEYIDWYMPGYNQYSIISHAIDTFVDLMSVNAKIDELIKIRSDGSGKWVLLEKYANSTSTDWTDQYKVVGSQNGTIQFLSTLYNYSSIIGYDSDVYDSSPYDSIIITEIRNILEALRDEILIDDLQVEYLNLFFASLRYALSEQHYLDWAFKTSLIKAKHNVGEFTNRITYRNDNLENYEDYVSETKPYRTKIREYISCYSRLENSNVAVTDFDLPPIYENQKTNVIHTYISNNQVVADNPMVTTYPWKYWYDNCIPGIISFNILNSGDGYTKDNIKIIIKYDEEDKNQKIIQPAVVRPVLSNGKLVDIEIIDPGKGYYTSPLVIVPVASVVSAIVTANIGSNVRSPFIKLKFDRISQVNSIDNIIQIEEFTTSISSSTAFPLQWPPSNKFGEAAVFVKKDSSVWEEIPPNLYELSTIKSGNEYRGVIKFLEPLANNVKIKVEYYRDQDLLTAADRIKHYYAVPNNELDKDSFKSILGVDYGGVNIRGLSLTVNKGWDTLPFYSDRWGFSDDNFNDYTVKIPELSLTNNYLIQLPYVPKLNELINIYYVESYSKSQESNLELLDYEFDPAINVSSVYLTYTKVFNATSSNSKILNLSNTTDINIGDMLLDTNILSGFVVAIENNILTIDSEIDLSVDDVIKFSSDVFGGINPALYYYVHSVESNQIQIKSFKDSSEPITDLINGVGKMAFQTTKYFIRDAIVIRKTESTITLDYPIVNDINDNTSLKFTRNLIPSKDFVIYSKGVLSLLAPIPSNMLINIIGYKNAIQLDNINFEKSWNINEIVNENILVSSDIISFNVGDPIKFNGVIYGNIIENTVYYVHSIINQTQFKISSIQNGEPFTLVAGTGMMTAQLIIDSQVIMNTWVGNGIDNVIEIPKLPETLFNVSSNDQFVIRNITSDGSIMPHDSDFDTTIDGGDLAYSTARGIAVDDVIIDGDDSILSAANGLEEVVSGQLVDAVAIKVFDNPRVNTQLISANIAVDTYTSDGITKSFRISQTPNSPDAIVVKTVEFSKVIKINNLNHTLAINDIFTNNLSKQGRVLNVEENIITYELIGNNDFIENDIIFLDTTQIGVVINKSEYPVFKIKQINEDYQVNYDINEIEFLQPLRIKNKVSIFSIGFNGGVFGVDYIKVDNVDKKYLTKYPYSITGYRAPIVYVDGISQSNVTFFKGNKDELGIEFASTSAISFGSLISVLLVENTALNFAVTKKQVFKGNNTHTYSLELGVGEKQPIENSMIVRVDQKILSPISSNLNTEEYQYIADPPSIQFTKVYNENSTIEVISSYKHDILDIIRLYTSSSLSNNYAVNTPNRYYYSNIASGLIKLPNIVVNSDFIWITKNGTLLTPKVDYRLTSDHQNVQLTDISDPSDKFDIIIYNSNLLPSGIAYMQFKDMLNRVHFKRLNQNKLTRLSKELKYNDDIIELEDASNFEIPDKYQNKPGIIEIYGERIEYFTINGNVLGKLRRGTLGTGILESYAKGTLVQDIGSKETIPYVDTIQFDQIIYRDTNIIDLSTIDTSFANDVKYKNIEISDYPLNEINELKTTLSQNSLDVFVGGYITPVAWTVSTKYYVDDLVILGEYTYKCIKDHVSSSSFNADYNFIDTDDINNKWQYFIGNIHLKKDPYKVHNINTDRFSPAGDIEFNSDFVVDQNTIKLENSLLPGTHVVVSKRSGLDWDSIVNIQDAITTLNIDEKVKEISKFITAVPGSLPLAVK